MDIKGCHGGKPTLRCDCKAPIKRKESVFEREVEVKFPLLGCIAQTMSPCPHEGTASVRKNPTVNAAGAPGLGLRRWGLCPTFRNSQLTTEMRAQASLWPPAPQPPR